MNQQNHSEWMNSFRSICLKQKHPPDHLIRFKEIVLRGCLIDQRPAGLFCLFWCRTTVFDCLSSANTLFSNRFSTPDPPFCIFFFLFFFLFFKASWVLVCKLWINKLWKETCLEKEEKIWLDLQIEHFDEKALPFFLLFEGLWVSKSIPILILGIGSRLMNT